MSTVFEYGKCYGAEPSSIGQYEGQWLANLKEEIKNTSDYENNLLINLTWINWDDSLINWIFAFGSPENTKIWFAGTVDGVHWIIHTHYMRYLRMLGWKWEFVGNSITHFSTWFPRLMIQHNDLSYFEPTDMKYLFLSYNRKPRVWREELVKQLIENNLHTLGFITFEEGYFPEIDCQSKEHDQ